MKTQGKLSYYTFILLSAIIIICSFSHNEVADSKSRVIAWDVYGYYVYLPAVFIYHDTREYKFAEEHLKKYQLSSDLYQLKRIDAKALAPGYTMGLAILWLPFFLVAHVFAAATHLYPADGLSFPYQLAIIIASWFYATIGIWFLRKALLKFFSDNITALTIAALVLGTNYFDYAAYESGMPHALLFSLYAILFYLTCLWYGKPTLLLSASIGAVIALACLCRPSELVAIFFFILFALQGTTSLLQRPAYLWHNRIQLLVIVIAGCVVVAPQVLYWHFNIGRWFYNGYQDHTFNFLHPQIINGLFSYRKGWLVYTPMMLFALAGFFTKGIRRAGLLYAVLACFIINIYIVFSWDTWWYASSFGSRAMVQSYALLAIPFASFLTSVNALKTSFIKALICIVMVLFVLLNQFQNWQYQHGVLPRDETTKTFYWKIFGKTQISDPQLKRYLDIDEALPEGKTYYPLTLNNCSDSVIKTVANNSFGPTEVATVTGNNLTALSQNWLRVKTEVMASGDLCTPWHEASLVLNVERNGKSIKWSSLRFQGFIKPRQWGEVKYEVRLPALQPGDQLKAFIWNLGPDTISQRCINLQLLQEKEADKGTN